MRSLKFSIAAGSKSKSRYGLADGESGGKLACFLTDLVALRGLVCGGGGALTSAICCSRAVTLTFNLISIDVSISIGISVSSRSSITYLFQDE